MSCRVNKHRDNTSPPAAKVRFVWGRKVYTQSNMLRRMLSREAVGAQFRE